MFNQYFDRRQLGAPTNRHREISLREQPDELRRVHPSPRSEMLREIILSAETRDSQGQRIMKYTLDELNAKFQLLRSARDKFPKLTPMWMIWETHMINIAVKIANTRR